MLSSLPTKFLTIFIFFFKTKYMVDPCPLQWKRPHTHPVPFYAFFLTRCLFLTVFFTFCLVPFFLQNFFLKIFVFNAFFFNKNDKFCLKDALFFDKLPFSIVLFFGTVKDIVNDFHGTKNQMRGFCVNGNFVSKT